MSGLADVINNTGAIMDLIASIKFIENRFGGYTPKQTKNKLAPKNSNNHAVYQKNARTEQDHITAEDDTPLGHNIDITA